MERWPLEDSQEWLDERAGIREFDGGYDRATADRLALEDMLNEQLRREDEYQEEEQS